MSTRVHKKPLKSPGAPPEPSPEARTDELDELQTFIDASEVIEDTLRALSASMKLVRMEANSYLEFVYSAFYGEVSDAFVAVAVVVCDWSETIVACDPSGSAAFIQSPFGTFSATAHICAVETWNELFHTLLLPPRFEEWDDQFIAKLKVQIIDVSQVMSQLERERVYVKVRLIETRPTALIGADQKKTID